MATKGALSKQLRSETKLAHRLVESTRLAKAFFQGKLTTALYAEGLARLYPVYATMETALSSLPHGHRLKPFALPIVFRSSALLADLRFFGVSPEPLRAGASARYYERVRHVADEAPALLVAHAYVRYMADVSGGVIAGRIAQRVLRLPTREGLSFLSFPQVASPAAFREDFRRRLDAFACDAEERAEILREANRVFDYNRDLADELWGDLAAAPTAVRA